MFCNIFSKKKSYLQNEDDTSKEKKNISISYVTGKES